MFANSTTAVEILFAINIDRCIGCHDKKYQIWDFILKDLGSTRNFKIWCSYGMLYIRQGNDSRMVHCRRGLVGAWEKNSNMYMYTENLVNNSASMHNDISIYQLTRGPCALTVTRVI